jgi:16S rRNA (uracil1498-N3)-methyltransferase
MRRRFFVERMENGAAVLAGAAAAHLGRVLRAAPGQLYELSDGREVWLGRIERVSESRVEFALVEPVAAHHPRLNVVLLLSVVKFDRFEWCLEKATELGVATVMPVSAERCEKGLLAAAPKRAERWRKILLEAAQQARRIAPPALCDVQRPAEAAAACPGDAARLLLSERLGAPALRQILESCREASAAALAIGPEGGWTERELELFDCCGFQHASLGPLILRTETAVIAGLAALNYALGENS